MKAKIYLEEGAKMPVRATGNSVGYDLYAKKGGTKIFDISEKSFNAVFDTGIRIAPEEGYWCEVCPNSRLVKIELMMPNSKGVIDPDYRGTIKVALRGLSPASPEVLGYLFDVKYQNKPAAQMIFHRMIDCDFEQVQDMKELGETERGEGGFGSTEGKIR